MCGEGVIINLPVDNVFYLQSEGKFEIYIANKDFTKARTIDEFLHRSGEHQVVFGRARTHLYLVGEGKDAYTCLKKSKELIRADKIYNEFYYNEKDEKLDGALIKTTGDLIKFSNFLKNKFTSEKEINSYLNF